MQILHIQKSQLLALLKFDESVTFPAYCVTGIIADFLELNQDKGSNTMLAPQLISNIVPLLDPTDLVRFQQCLLVANLLKAKHTLTIEGVHF